MTEKEKSLQDRLREGDTSVMETIYLEHREAFIHYGFKYNLDRETLLDIYQDAIIALYQNFYVKRVVLSQSNLKTYLFGIGKHKIYDYLKKDGRLIKTDSTYSLDQRVVFMESDDEITQEQKLLASHFGRLSESCQKLLQMYYYRNLTIKEIVQHSQYKDENTVKSHKSRCLKGLKERIKAQ